MTYRLKRQVDIIWLNTPITLVTEWKKALNGNMIPKRWTTGHAGMALVVVTLPNGQQQQHFATREEVEMHFEEEEAPEHVQGETTHVPFVTPWWQWIPGSPLTLPSTHNVWRESTSSCYISPPEAGKAV